MELSIQKANTNYALQLGIVRAFVWQSTYAGKLPKAAIAKQIDALWDIAHVESYVSQNTVQVAIVNNAIVGYIACGSSTSDNFRGMGEIFDIGVIPSYQDKGIGGLLLETAKEDLKTKGITKIVAKCPKWSPFVYFFIKNGASIAKPVSQITELMSGEQVVKNILIMQ